MAKLKPINVMLTAVGSPGASTIIRYLKEIREREVRILSVDASKEPIGRFLSDAFLQVPLATDPAYIDALLDFGLQHDADALLVSSSYEVEIVAKSRQKFESAGIKVLVSSPESLKVANNKRRLYEMFVDHPQVNVPEFRVVRSLDELISGCKKLGYPQKALCFKPSFSKGGRGFRYLSADVNRADLLLNHKPDSPFISLEEVIEIFRQETAFPELLLMETVQGEEIDSMVLALKGDPLLITHKTREQERSGTITLGGHCKRPEIDTAIKAILSKVPLSYNFNMQFKGGYLIEINPRLSTFLYTDTWVEPYFALKLALGEYQPDEVRKLQQKVPLNLRMIRYFDQYFYDKDAL